MTVSNGGLNAPLPDMVRYMNFLLGDAARQSDYDAILKRSSLDEMWRPQISAGTDFTQGRMATTTQSGLSFFVDSGKNGVRFVGHNGDQNGFKAYLSLCPDQHAGTLLALNTETKGTESAPTNRDLTESRITLAADRLCEALAAR